MPNVLKTPLPVHWYYFGLFLAAILPAAFTLDPALDHDTWWHAAVGRWIVENRSLPDVDPFSRLGQEQGVHWVAYSWLHELVVAFLLQNTGETGIFVFRSLLGASVVAAALAHIHRNGSRDLGSVLTALIACALLMPLMKERPWHFSILFAIGVLSRVQRYRAGDDARCLRWLPLLFVLWANLHIQFLVGWMILGLAWLFPGQGSRRPLTWALVACGLATLVNPYHLRLWGVIFEYARDQAPGEFIHELAPLDLRSVWAVLVLLTVVLAALQLLGQPRRQLPFPALLLIVGVIATLHMRREIWLVMLALLATLPQRSESRPHWPVLALTALVFALIRLSAGWVPNASNPERFPVGAVIYLKDHPQEGLLYNPFDWGGYLIWHLPRLPVSMDGRTNLYGDERLRTHFRVAEGDANANDPMLASANLLIGPTGSPLMERLTANPQTWEPLYQDRTAVVLRRRK